MSKIISALREKLSKLILAKKERNYERYFLKRNPFPYAGVPEEESAPTGKEN
ncbi:MAG: hypothetical protein AOA65_1637 [Candidatus Bathyarchaeota archaeon BA1]|nr:MAG: hypothetical protein AOA65_1637 [Candidatus Bathyarchaeota archaeon BA1]